MCKGPIVAPPGKKMVEAKSSFSLTEFFKRFWERITCSAVSSDQPKVNMCLKCGDLQVDEEWLKIPHPQKPAISGAIKSGGISINGYLAVCNFCASMEKEVKEKRDNLYKGSSSFLDFEQVTAVSSMSF